VSGGANGFLPGDLWGMGFQVGVAFAGGYRVGTREKDSFAVLECTVFFFAGYFVSIEDLLNEIEVYEHCDCADSRLLN
jgi:hypothetical protein